MRTFLHLFNTPDPESICTAIENLEATYKKLKIISIIKEERNYFIYYQIGSKTTSKKEFSKKEVLKNGT